MRCCAGEVLRTALREISKVIPEPIEKTALPLHEPPQVFTAPFCCARSLSSITEGFVHLRTISIIAAKPINTLNTLVYLVKQFIIYGVFLGHASLFTKYRSLTESRIAFSPTPRLLSCHLQFETNLFIGHACACQ